MQEKIDETGCVRALGRGATMRDWLNVPKAVFANDPNYVPQPDFLEKRKISRKVNPFFRYGTAEFFVAYKDEVPVGRIAAIFNPRYHEHHHATTGHFGFFDCIDDAEVSDRLLETVENWHIKQGMTRLLGPFSLTINEESGVLVEGFEEPAAIMTNQARPWFGPLLESYGFVKAMDLFAYRVAPNRGREKADRLIKLSTNEAKITTRWINMRRYREDTGIVFDIFNDAWSENWGFIPFSQEDKKHLASEMRPIVSARSGRIAEIDGVPFAMMMFLPDLNRLFAEYEGKLLPFNWARLIHARIKQDWRTARVPLLGVRKAYQGGPLALTALSQLTRELSEMKGEYTLDWIEYSWVLETNSAMRKLAEYTAGSPVKTWRIYEKALPHT